MYESFLLEGLWGFLPPGSINTTIALWECQAAVICSHPGLTVRVSWVTLTLRSSSNGETTWHNRKCRHQTDALEEVAVATQPSCTSFLSFYLYCLKWTDVIKLLKTVAVCARQWLRLQNLYLVAMPCIFIYSRDLQIVFHEALEKTLMCNFYTLCMREIHSNYIIKFVTLLWQIQLVINNVWCGMECQALRHSQKENSWESRRGMKAWIKAAASQGKE